MPKNWRWEQVVPTQRPAQSLTPSNVSLKSTLPTQFSSQFSKALWEDGRKPLAPSRLAKPLGILPGDF